MTTHDFCCTETAFDAIQLELPGVPTNETVAADWQNPLWILAEFLNAVGVSYSARTAQSLLNEFNSLAELLAAPAWRLRLVAGKRLADLICASSGLIKAELIDRARESPVLQRSPALLKFLQLEVGFLDHERLLALYLDCHSRLMRIEKLAEGSLAHATISAREVIGRGLAMGASAFILVHNHPSGTAENRPARLGTEPH